MEAENNYLRMETVTKDFMKKESLMVLAVMIGMMAVIMKVHLKMDIDKVRAC